MNWNKEKVVFAAAVVVALVVIFLALQQLGRDVGIQLNPQEFTRGKSLDAEYEFPRYEMSTPTSPRDPFEVISSWAGAERDELPAPQLGQLYRRVPLPAGLAGARFAYPLPEPEPPARD